MTFCIVDLIDDLQVLLNSCVVQYVTSILRALVAGGLIDAIGEIQYMAGFQWFGIGDRGAVAIGFREL